MTDTRAPLSAHLDESVVNPNSPSGHSEAPAHARPSFVFCGVVAAATLAIDIASKVWAEITLLHRPTFPIVVIEDSLNFTLVYNPAGAWGMFQGASEEVRKPFFVLITLVMIWFIVSIYGHLAPRQRALKWGLPLVLGGALGNLADRITRSQVIDFIDYRADWVRSMNEFIASFVGTWNVTDHWPTFNAADIAICVGWGLMTVDVITARRGARSELAPSKAMQELPGTAATTQPAVGQQAVVATDPSNQSSPDEVRLSNGSAVSEAGAAPAPADSPVNALDGGERR